MSELKEERYTTEPLVGGFRFLLPKRELGAVRHFGWLGVLIGLVGLVFMFFWMSMPILEGIQQIQKQQADGWMFIGFGLLGLFMFFPTMGTILFGLTIALNRTRCVVEFRGGKLYSIEKMLLYSWRRKRRVENLMQLEIMGAAEEKADPQYKYFENWLGDFTHAIVAQCSDGDRFQVAPFYSREILLGLAEDLAERLESETYLRKDDDFDGMIEARDPTSRKIPVIDGDEDVKTGKKHVASKPPESDITVDRHDLGITICIPPSGIWKGSRGLIVFALIWNLVCGSMFVSTVLMALGIVPNNGDPINAVTFLFLTPFILVGIGVLLLAINMGRRKAALATADNRLIVVHESIFGKKVREYTTDQIASICVGYSGMEVNDEKVNELQILPHDGNKLGLLSQRTDPELEWIATELNQALSIVGREESGALALRAECRDERGRVIAAHDSSISIDYTGKSVIVTAMPKGFARYLGGLIIGGIFATVGFIVAVVVIVSTIADGFDAGDIGTVLFFAAWCTIFGGVGFALALCSYVAARREFSIEVDGEDVAMVRKGPFGQKREQWHHSEIASIKVADSGWQVNNSMYQQLNIELESGSTKSLMLGQSESDLTLAAAAVNEQLEQIR